MTFRTSIVLFALCTAFAVAQSEDEGTNFEDLLNQLGEDESPAPAPAPAPAPQGETRPPIALSEEARNQRITDNYGETVEIYETILQNQNTNTERLDKRIASLERMLADYRPKYEQYATIVRGIDSQLIQEANRLKADKRSGALSQAEYDRRIEEAEGRAERTAGDAREQRDFYGEEIARAEGTLADLKAEREVLARNAELQRQADLASGKIQPEEPGYLQQVLDRHRRLGRIPLGHPSESFELNLAIVRKLTRNDD